MKTSQSTKSAKTSSASKKAERTKAKPANSKLKLLKEQLQQGQDEKLRLLAEIQNLHRRQAQELTKAHADGLLSGIPLLFDTLDHLEQALKFAQPAESKNAANKPSDSLYQGVRLTYDSLINGLKNLGIEQLNPEGEQFNPSFHEALSRVKIEGKQSGEIIAVIQKGYNMGERLLRPAKVQVAE